MVKDDAENAIESIIMVFLMFILIVKLISFIFIIFPKNKGAATAIFPSESAAAFPFLFTVLLANDLLTGG